MGGVKGWGRVVVWAQPYIRVLHRLAAERISPGFRGLGVFRGLEV